MGKSLTASEKPVAKIFNDDYVFTIPSYQRPYSWTIEQAGELLVDLYEAVAGATLDDVAERPPYFLGSIVLIKQDSMPPAEVVDGQQRLTTLTLLLSAIRASLSDPKAQHGLSRLIYEQGDVITGTENRYRLALRNRDRDFFRDFVQADDGIRELVVMDGKLPDSQNNLRQNAKLFMDWLSQIEERQRLTLASFVAQRCFLVAVSTPDLDSAYRIFDVLNSRGLDLGATDILKAEIIGKIDANRRDQYSQKWEDIEEDLGREDFGNLFSQIRMIYRKAKPQGTLLKEFRDHVEHASPEVFVDDVLTPLASAYREIAGADYSSQKGAEKVNEHLKWLNRIEFKDWMPPALKFLAMHRNEPEDVATFFRGMERLVYAMLIARWGLNARIDRCSRLTHAIEERYDLSTEDSPLLLSGDEKRNVYGALAGAIYDTHSARALSTILLRLDSLLSGGAATYDYDIVTVEHVLPQNPEPGSEWLTWFPDEEQRAYWVNRLGNLALLTRKKNSAAGNREFGWKKESYFSRNGISPFAITTQVLARDQWTPKIVESRQLSLLSVFEKHLGLDDRSVAPVISVPEPELIELTDIDRPFFCKASGADAKALCTSEGVWVLKGSTGRAEVVESLKAHHAYSRLRHDLLEQCAIILVEGGRIRFERDYFFDSPSAAAVAVMGRPANGWIEWRDEQGMTLRAACAAAESNA